MMLNETAKRKIKQNLRNAYIPCVLLGYLIFTSPTISAWLINRLTLILILILLSYTF